MFEKLKKKWNIKSNTQFVLINIIFALAGMSVVWVRKPLYQFLGIGPETALWIKILIYPPLVLPIYQMNLIIFATLFGQFPFFWDKQKQVGRFFLRIFGFQK